MAEGLYSEGMSRSRLKNATPAVKVRSGVQRSVQYREDYTLVEEVCTLYSAAEGQVPLEEV